MEVSIPTLIDHLTMLFMRGDVTKQLETLRPSIEQAAQPLIDLLALGGLALLRIADRPPSAGYEPLLTKDGFDPIVARGISYVVAHSGRRQARESKRRRPLFDAIRFLAKLRWKGAVSTRAKIILAAWEQTSIVETAFVDAGLDEQEFISLLKIVVSKEDVDHGRLTEIAAQLAPSLSMARGPKVSAPSAAHDFFLEHGIELSKRRLPHSRKDRTAENCDALTEATRFEFAAPHFDSRPAKRRARRPKVPTTNS